jgi:hypothetical protein
MGGSSTGGQLLLFGPNDDRTDPDDAVVSIDSLGNLRMGGGGEDGDIFLFPAAGNRSNSDTATVHVEAETATIRMGGRGVPGEVLLFPAGGDRTDKSTATISVDAEFANMRLGGGGVDGDIFSSPPVPTDRTMPTRRSYGRRLGRHPAEERRLRRGVRHRRWPADPARWWSSTKAGA